MAAVKTALLVLLLAAPVVYGTQYTVGDTGGWNSGIDYTTWLSDKTFKVGDTLVFNYDSTHKVDEVNEADYNSCSASNVLKSHDGPTTTIELSKAGSVYFLCPTAGHCQNGMKLKVDVKEASAPVGSPPTPTTPSPPSPSGSSSPGTTTPPSPSGAASIAVGAGSIVLATLLLHYIMG